MLVPHILEEFDKNIDEMDLCITAICMQVLHQELHKIRPSNMYPPVGYKIPLVHATIFGEIMTKCSNTNFAFD